MQVIVKLKSATRPVGAATRDASRSRDALRAAAEKFGAQSRPLHPGTRDAELALYHVVDLPDARRADELIAALLESPFVDGAYAKPPDALP